MPNPENVIGKGNRFKKGESGNPKGRPPKLISSVTKELKEQGYTPATKSQIIDAYLTIIQLPLAKITEIASKDSEYPFLFKLIAKGFIGKGGADYLEKVITRGIGTPNQINEVSNTGEISIKIVREDD